MMANQRYLFQTEGLTGFTQKGEQESLLYLPSSTAAVFFVSFSPLLSLMSTFFQKEEKKNTSGSTEDGRNKERTSLGKGCTHLLVSTV